MIIRTTDNNPWISSVTGTPLNAKGKVVREGDADAIANPAYGTTTKTEVEDPVADLQAWDELTFRRRFTQAERIAIEAAKTQSAELADFESLLQCAGRSGKLIYNTDPDLIAGLEALKNAGILTPARKAEILGG